jgi:hypothetical protein
MAGVLTPQAVTDRAEAALLALKAVSEVLAPETRIPLECRDVRAIVSYVSALIAARDEAERATSAAYEKMLVASAAEAVLRSRLLAAEQRAEQWEAIAEAFGTVSSWADHEHICKVANKLRASSGRPAGAPDV